MELRINRVRIKRSRPVATKVHVGAGSGDQHIARWPFRGFGVNITNTNTRLLLRHHLVVMGLGIGGRKYHACAPPAHPLIRPSLTPDPSKNITLPPLTILFPLPLLDNNVTLSSQYKLISIDVTLFCRFEQLAES